MMRLRRSLPTPRRPRLSPSLVGRPALLLAALCVFMMPTNMRGGAETPHPHAFFQFWGEDAHEIFDHHGGVDDHARPQRSATTYVAGPGMLLDDRPCQPHTQRAPQFPAIEELGSPYEQASMLAAVEIQPFGAIEPGGAAAILPSDHDPAGRLDAPEAPPPRAGLV